MGRRAEKKLGRRVEEKNVGRKELKKKCEEESSEKKKKSGEENCTTKNVTQSEEDIQT